MLSVLSEFSEISPREIDQQCFVHESVTYFRIYFSDVMYFYYANKLYKINV